jgi:hypothetical protein
MALDADCHLSLFPMCVIVMLNVNNLSVVLVSVAARLASFSVTTNFLRFCDDAKKKNWTDCISIRFVHDSTPVPGLSDASMVK